MSTYQTGTASSPPTPLDTPPLLPLSSHARELLSKRGANGPATPPRPIRPRTGLRTKGTAYTMELARESIWSVERGTKTLYFILFIFQFFVGMILVFWKTASEHDGWLNITLTAWQDAAPIAITSAASAIAVTEIGRYLMVLASSLEEKLERTRERRRAEGRAEGRTEMYAKWEAWNRRRTAAEEKGEPFDEPPPSKD